MTQVRPLRELAPHLVWEAVLLLAAGGVVAGLYNANSAVFSRGQVWSGIAILGFAACGLALSLRTATPNLAVAPIALLSGWVYAEQVNDGTAVATAFILAVLAASGVGLLFALFVGLTALPAWAVTLGGGFIVTAALIEATGGQLVAVRGGGRATAGFGVWATVFVVVSIGGAVLFALPAVRRLLTANRPVAGGDDPAAWRPAKLVGALVGVGGSAVLMGVAGVLTVRLTRAAAFVDAGQLPYALAAVLLAGVSVFGRRAGVFGVVLAVVIVDGVRRWQALEGVGSATVLLTTGVLAVVGLVAVWLLELVGRRIAPLSAAPSVVVPGAPGLPPFGPPPVYDGGFPHPRPPLSAPPVSGVPGFVPAGTSSPVPGAAPQSGIPAQSTGYPPPPPPTSGGPAFGQPTYPSPPGQQYGAPPPAGGPGYPPGGYPPPLSGAQPGAMIPQPWTVPGAGGAQPQVPSQSVSPPVSGPPNSDPPPHPQAPPPSWPPRT